MKKEKDENQVEMKLDNFAENEKNAKKEKLIEEIKKEKTNNKTESDEKMTEAEKVSKIVKKAKESGKITYGELAKELENTNPEQIDKVFDAFEEMGVTVIEAKGQQFDPELHNAVMHEDNDELEENVVVEEFQKGYKYRDSVIRHSMVKVAN